MIYLITYEKNSMFKDYNPLTVKIKTLSHEWWHHMQRTWLVRSPHPVDEIYKVLKPSLADDDRILIIEVKRNYQGYLNVDGWKWLNDQFDKEENRYNKS